MHQCPSACGRLARTCTNVPLPVDAWLAHAPMSLCLWTLGSHMHQRPSACICLAPSCLASIRRLVSTGSSLGGAVRWHLQRQLAPMGLRGESVPESASY